MSFLPLESLFLLLLSFFLSFFLASLSLLYGIIHFRNLPSRVGLLETNACDASQRGGGIRRSVGGGGKVGR